MQIDIVLLTGARREEMASLTWANVDFKGGKPAANMIDQVGTLDAVVAAARSGITPKKRPALARANAILKTTTAAPLDVLPVRRARPPRLSRALAMLEAIDKPAARGR